ncbi:MAG: FAD-binding oxidoreductase [Gammaproteobacteria bacterium]|nr:FAD-binding oxidoreductase [Gammaproteobacteria bacterium]MDH5776676.1 FAD-binding oxidoreductase [Gammaproteobacteria bacterium]
MDAIKLFSIVLLMSMSQLVSADTLSSFSTDGCSSFPEGTIKHQSLWADCCLRHDLAYWKGGTYEERKTADDELAACVTKVGEPEIAKLMLAGVRVGGSPYFPTTFRWGYGWSYPRTYQPLSKDEKQQVREKIKLFVTMINVFSRELKKEIGE